MSEIIYTSFGSDIVDIVNVENIAKGFELEYRIEDNGIIVFFDTTSQRAWFGKQIENLYNDFFVV
jgi:hypothetical protein